MSTTIILTEEEVQWAHSVGLERYRESRRMNLPQSDLGRPGANQIETDKQAAAGELAFCKFMGFEWEATVNTFKLPDAMGVYQIRQTDLERGSLIVREKDSDNEPYVLITGKGTQFKVVGWMMGGDAKQDKWIRNPNDKKPAWFVPQREINKNLDALREFLGNSE